MNKGASVPDQALVSDQASVPCPDPSGFDPSRGNNTHFPAPPKLGGGVKPTQWLLSVAEADKKKGATYRAKEARAIAHWLVRIARWLEDQAFDVPAAIAIEARSDATPKSGAAEGESAAIAQPLGRSGRKGDAW